MPTNTNTVRGSRPGSTRRAGIRNDAGVISTPTRRGNFVAPNAYLSTLLRGSDVSVEDVKEAIRGIKRVQERAGSTHRFHLFMESDLGQSQSRSTELFDNISTGLLFSPTICPYDEDEEDDISLLARVLNGISSKAALHTPTANRSTAERTGSASRRPTEYEGRRPPPRRLFDTDDEDGPENDEQPCDRDEDFEPNDVPGQLSDDEHRVAEVGSIPSGIKLPAKASWPNYIRRRVRIPHWYPFKHGEYKTGNQMSSEILYVDDDYIRKFEFDDDRYMKWIYREFFRYVFNEARRRKVRGLGKSLKYSEFTPPWIRPRIIRGEEGNLQNQLSLFLPKVALTDIRDQRSTWGVRRLMFLLGAFYQEEPDMSCAPLDHLLGQLRYYGDQHNGKKRRIEDVQQPRSSQVRRWIPPSTPLVPTTIIDDEEVLEPQGGSSAPQNSTIRMNEEVAQMRPETREHEQNLTAQSRSASISEDVEPTCSGSISNTRFTIRCAAGSACSLRDSVIYQSVRGFEKNGITGSCRGCKKPLHDLCGGGEDGPMLCPACTTLRARQEMSLT